MLVDIRRQWRRTGKVPHETPTTLGAPKAKKVEPAQTEPKPKPEDKKDEAAPEAKPAPEPAAAKKSKRRSKAKSVD